MKTAPERNESGQKRRDVLRRGLSRRPAALCSLCLDRRVVTIAMLSFSFAVWIVKWKQKGKMEKLEKVILSVSMSITWAGHYYKYKVLGIVSIKVNRLIFCVHLFCAFGSTNV